jgi:hypothetical protein
MFGHWLLFDALNATITMSLKFKKEFGISFNLEDLIDNNFVVVLELSLVASIIRREICEVLDGFFSFFKKNEKKKNHITCCPLC